MALGALGDAPGGSRRYVRLGDALPRGDGPVWVLTNGDARGQVLRRIRYIDAVGTLRVGSASTLGPPMIQLHNAIDITVGWF